MPMAHKTEYVDVVVAACPPFQAFRAPLASRAMSSSLALELFTSLGLASRGGTLVVGASWAGIAAAGVHPV